MTQDTRWPSLVCTLPVLDDTMYHHLSSRTAIQVEHDVQGVVIGPGNCCVHVAHFRPAITHSSRAAFLGSMNTQSAVAIPSASSHRDEPAIVTAIQAATH